VLFSNPQVARFINRSFEPVWESVRPVPIVRIDFGAGPVITRTLHGNIATYICTAERQVLDVLPGIYAPAAYRDALDQLRILATNLALQPAGQRDQWLRAYHEQSAQALKKGEAPARLVAMAKLPPVGKATIELPVELVIRGGNAVPGAEEVPLKAAEDLASWQALAEDTRLNEKARRLLIHEKLTQSGVVEPGKVCKWLYKEVLHADLDDPYLGLGKVLSASDPFRNEARSQ
jgi:hypothetical protein